MVKKLEILDTVNNKKLLAFIVYVLSFLLFFFPYDLHIIVVGSFNWGNIRIKNIRFSASSELQLFFQKHIPIVSTYNVGIP